MNSTWMFIDIMDCTGVVIVCDGRQSDHHLPFTHHCSQHAYLCVRPLPCPRRQNQIPCNVSLDHHEYEDGRFPHRSVVVVAVIVVFLEASRPLVIYQVISSHDHLTYSAITQSFQLSSTCWPWNSIFAIRATVTSIIPVHPGNGQ